MGRLTDVVIRNWIKAGEHFIGRSDGDGLTLAFPERFTSPVWKYRYRFAGHERVMTLGSYRVLSLADARKEARRLAAQVALGHDVAGEKQQRIRDGEAKIKADRNRVTVSQLADEYFQRQVLGKWKHPNIVRSRIERDIKPAIGSLNLEDVRAADIDAMLQVIVRRGAPTTANDVLRWTRRMFNYAIKREMVRSNPALAFDISDAGGKEEARKRILSRDELIKIFVAMRQAKGFSFENQLTIRLLLMLAVRKQELTAARVDEFDLERATWTLPAERSKNGDGIVIPLPTQALAAVRELIRLGCGSEYLLPARKAQDRMLPHIHENTLNQAMVKLRPHLGDMPRFTIHDFRRTAKSLLQSLGTMPHVSERCLNHKIKGVEGIYDRHDYFEDRMAALTKLATLLESLERGHSNVVPMRSAA